MLSKLKNIIRVKDIDYVILFSIIILFLLVIFKINGSSIYSFYDYFPSTGDSHKTFLFEPRSIRSDEWMVGTPWRYSQYNSGFQKTNPNIGLGQPMSVAILAPIKDWISIFRPSQFLFFFCSFEYAYSFYWYSRLIFLFIFSYLFFKKISKKVLVGIFSALYFIFAPHFHWWFSVGYLELAAYFFAIIYLFWILLEKLIRNDTFSYPVYFILIYLSLCFIFLIYPPAQIPILWLFLFAIFVIFFIDKKLYKIFLKKWYLFLFLVLFDMFIFLLFYIDNKSTIDITLNTSYPGKRMSQGGDLKLINLFSGPFNIQFVKENIVLPKGFANTCEASSFLFYFPVIIVYILIQFIINIFKKNKSNWRSFLSKYKTIFPILFFIIFILIWGFIGFGSEFLSSITLLNRVPPKRTIISLGIANSLLIGIFLSKVKVKKNLILSCLISSLASAFYFLFGLHFRDSTNGLFVSNVYKIAILALFIFITSFFLLTKRSLIFFCLVSLYSFISIYQINPVNIGLDPLMRSSIVNKSKEISQNYPEERWIVFDDITLADTLSAHNIKLLNGTMPLPQLDLWEKFDTDKEYIDIYNRYAHVQFSVSSEEVSKFVLVSPDWFRVEIDPCSEVLRELNVGILVSRFGGYERFYCLEKVDSVPLENGRLTFYHFID